MDRMKHLYLSCACRNPDHVVRITLDAYFDPPEFSIQPMLNPNPSFWRRVWIALRYMFGLPSREEGWGSCHFSDVVLSSEQVDELSTLLTHRKVLLKLRDMKKKKELLDRKVKPTGDGDCLENS